jgi:UrcA family protein
VSISAHFTKENVMKALFQIVSATALAAAIAFTGSSNATEARATGRDDVPTKIVSSADLDLANPSDVRTLYRRVRDAARAVCLESARQEGEIATLTWRAYCYRSAIDRAIASAGDERLSALHRGDAQRIVGLR